jgi:phosphatidylserine/phosphatidylglycerophosphate/cardiolipin synthase-like enzyme
MVRRFSDPERSKLDVILVMPDGADTPKEDLVLGARQRAVRHRVARVAEQNGHRFRLLKSVQGAGQSRVPATFIHSKLLIVDDELLNIGSANLTNRSMGLDTELNVSCSTALESPRDAARLRGEIAALRANLLAEHAGSSDASRFLAIDGLVEAVDEACNDPRSKLCCQPISEPERGNELLTTIFDPARPLDWESVDEGLRDAEDWLRT